MTTTVYEPSGGDDKVAQWATQAGGAATFCFNLDSETQATRATSGCACDRIECEKLSPLISGASDACNCERFSQQVVASFCLFSF